MTSSCLTQLVCHTTLKDIGIDRSQAKTKYNTVPMILEKYTTTAGPFFLYWLLILILKWICNRMSSQVCGAITYPWRSRTSMAAPLKFGNLNLKFEFEWISNSIPHFMMDVITYTCCKLIHISKVGPSCLLYWNSSWFVQYRHLRYGSALWFRLFKCWSRTLETRP